MSSTLTFASSGNGTKTGTTMATFFADLNTLITANAGNAAFFWQVAGTAIAGTPYSIVLSRKDGSAGRLAFIGLTSVFTNIQPVLWEQLPANNQIFVAWFPAGTGTALSNLNATSGTVCGNDTGAPYASSIQVVSTSYAANFVQFYFDSAEAFYLMTADPAAATTYCLGGGALVEDGSGTVYDATVGTGNQGWNSFSTTPLPTVAPSAKVLAGALPNSVQGYYAATKKQFYCPFSVSGGWAGLVHSSTDCILADDALSKAWFAPVPLMSQTRGEGAVLKFRQLGWGPGETSAFFTYTTTGPVVQARQMCNLTAGSNTSPWLTNFKI